ncbi:UNVERIFIED_CONTAM: hypothetical protein GTU68_006958 [Idotea baltica]|nr:hypothetical protein [Idotea baltica]
MSTISASDVKKLRDQTGAGMMDCKKALSEAEGDFEKAIELLRLKGQKLSLKRAEREAKEGVVVALISDDNKRGVVVKNDDFIALTQRIAEIALDAFPETIEDLSKLEMDGVTIEEKVIEQVGKIGEKIELASYERLEDALIVPYIHTGYRAGVIVSLNKASDSFQEAGRDVAMQVAAMKPVAVDKDGVDQSVIEKEVEIGKELARQEGKPEQLLEKIAMGKLNKFFKEQTLLNQVFVKDSSVSVGQYLKQLDKDLTVNDFKLVALG